MPQADQLLRRTPPKRGRLHRRRPGRVVRTARDRGQHLAARHRRIRAQASPAHRPFPDPVRGPAADRGRGRHQVPHRGRAPADRPAQQHRPGHPGACEAADRPHRPRLVARGPARDDQADHLPGPPGTGRPGTRLRRGLRPAASPRPRWRHRTARRRRHRARPPRAGRVLQPERRGPDDGHRRRLRGADRPRAARTRRAAAAPAAHHRARPPLQAGRAAPGHPARPARRRRARHGTVAQAHGLHLRGGPAPRGADPPGHRPPAAFGRAQRRHHPARHLGLSRRPPAAR